MDGLNSFDQMEFHHFSVLKLDDGSPWILGEGKFGTTYKAIDMRLHRLVALKVLKAEVVGSGSARGKFEEEARRTASLRHPNIAPIYYFGEEGGRCFYAMEFIDGTDVERHVAIHGPLSLHESLRIAAQVASALGAAHREGLVHRDIKPANIILGQSQDGGTTARIIDFGLSTAGIAKASRQTRFEGTPLYASPEQFDDGAVDARSDVYSLGATLFFMLSGHPPFAGSFADVEVQHTLQPLPIEVFEGLPPQVGSLLGRLMAKDPANRPRSGVQAAGEIESVLRLCRGAEAQSALEWMGSQFGMIEREGLLLGGAIYRVAKQRGEEEFAALYLDRSAEGLAAAANLLAVFPLLQSLTSRCVRRILQIAKTADGIIAIIEPMHGTRLLSVLRVRRCLSVPEALLIFEPLAHAIDEVCSAGIPLPHIGLRDILLQPASDPATCFADWKSLRPFVDILRVGEGNSGNVNATVVGDSSASSYQALTLQTSESADLLMASLVYETIGGRSAPRAGFYTPLAELSESVNAVLRRVFETSGSGKGASQLLYEILPSSSASLAPSSPARDIHASPETPFVSTRSASPEPWRAHGSHARKRRSVPLVAAAAVLAAAAAASFLSLPAKRGAVDPQSSEPLSGETPPRMIADGESARGDTFKRGGPSALQQTPESHDEKNSGSPSSQANSRQQLPSSQTGETVTVGRSESVPQGVRSEGGQPEEQQPAALSHSGGTMTVPASRNGAQQQAPTSQQAAGSNCIAVLSSETTKVGSPVVLNYRFVDTAMPEDMPRPSIDMDGLEILYNGMQTQSGYSFNFGGGSSRSDNSTAYEFRYVVTPNRPGTFTIPSFEVLAGGKLIRTKPVTLRVAGAGVSQLQQGMAPSNAPSAVQSSAGDKGGKPFFGETLIGTKAAYVGEVVPVELRFYFRADLSFDNLQRPSFGGEGFMAADLSEPEQNEQVINNVRYNAVTFRTAITPVKAGVLEIPPSGMTGRMVMHGPPFGNDPFFDQFFQNFPGMRQPENIEACTNRKKIEVLPLPKDGRPANFSGAIGQFTMNASASPSTTGAGEPVTLRLAVKGRGNFDVFTAPELAGADGWRTYAPKESFVAEPKWGFGNCSGAKTFEFNMVAGQNRTATPGARFTYFDPRDKKYVTLTADPVAVSASGSGGRANEGRTPSSAANENLVLSPTAEEDGKMSESQARVLLRALEGEEEKVNLLERRNSEDVSRNW